MEVDSRCEDYASENYAGSVRQVKEESPDDLHSVPTRIASGPERARTMSMAARSMDQSQPRIGQPEVAAADIGDENVKDEGSSDDSTSSGSEGS
jgi:hypothetical protein